MKIDNIPFHTTNWDNVEVTQHKGETGMAYWRTQYLGDIRIRMVEYSAGYFADHWCLKGHIILCTDGEMTTELQDGRKFVLKKGMTYQVGDNVDAHRSYTEGGAKLFIVD